VANQIAVQVVQRMIASAANRGDALLFHGSPREIMEEISVSSRPLHKELYDLGLRRRGRGAAAVWEIPSAVVGLVQDSLPHL